MSKSGTLFALMIALGIGSTAACGKDASCDKVVDHTLEIMPAEFKDKMGDKKDMIAKCEKELSDDERACAMKASSLPELTACRQKK